MFSIALFFLLCSSVINLRKSILKILIYLGFVQIVFKNAFHCFVFSLQNLVFICYKSTNAGGENTVVELLAKSVYSICAILGQPYLVWLRNRLAKGYPVT